MSLLDGCKRQVLQYLKTFVTGGRRGNVTMEKVLTFVTGADMEPALGFRIDPAIHFVDSDSPLPTANTCINKLSLSISANSITEARYFNFLDLGFSNAFYGLQ